MLIPNMAVLDAAFQHIKTNRYDWDQATWRCGTSGCIAFHIAELSSAEWLMDTRDDPKVPLPHRVRYCPVCLAGDGYCTGHPRSDRYQYDDVVTVDGRVICVEEYAREVAGLAAVEADRLFYSENTLSDLERIIGELRAEAARRPGAPREAQVPA